MVGGKNSKLTLESSVMDAPPASPPDAASDADEDRLELYRSVIHELRLQVDKDGIRIQKSENRTNRIRTDARNKFAAYEKHIAIQEGEIKASKRQIELLEKQLNVNRIQLDIKDEQLKANNELVSQQLKAKDEQLKVKDEQLKVIGRQLTQTLGIFHRATALVECGMDRARKATLKSWYIHALTDAKSSAKQLTYVAPAYTQRKMGMEVRIVTGSSSEEVERLVGTDGIPGAVPIATTSPTIVQKLILDRGNRLLERVKTSAANDVPVTSMFSTASSYWSEHDEDIFPRRGAFEDLFRELFSNEKSVPLAVIGDLDIEVEAITSNLSDLLVLMQLDKAHPEPAEDPDVFDLSDASVSGAPQYRSFDPFDSSNDWIEESESSLFRLPKIS